MKKILVSAFIAASALGLAACGEEATTTDDTAVVDPADTTSVDDGTMAAEPAMEGDAPAATATGAATTDGTDTVSVGPDGVSADINEGETNVKVDDKGATVTTN